MVERLSESVKIVKPIKNNDVKVRWPVLEASDGPSSTTNDDEIDAPSN